MNISKILYKWDRDREKISILTKRVDEYKKAINSEMNKSGKEILENDDFSCVRRKITREYISKETVPSEIFQKYKTKTRFETITLKKKGGNQKER